MKYFTIGTNNCTMGEIKNKGMEFGDFLDNNFLKMTTSVSKIMFDETFLDLFGKAFMEGKFFINMNEIYKIKTTAELTALCNETKAIVKISDIYLKNKNKYTNLVEPSL